jgi:hypothetical protein
MPQVEEVRHGLLLEYWITVKGKRRKICGYPRKGLPIGWVCIKRAGAGSNHLGYGFCMEHELIETPAVKRDLWLRLKSVHKANSLTDLLARAERVSEVSIKNMEADLLYLEIARQSILKLAEDTGTFSKEMRSDLAYISEVSAKVKALKVKTESINWIPPEQVGVMIMQILEAVTAGEDDAVKRRIALRAKDLQGGIVPRLVEKNPELPVYIRDKQIEVAVEVSKRYDPGYTTEVKRDPPYRKNKLRAKTVSGVDS